MSETLMEEWVGSQLAKVQELEHEVRMLRSYLRDLIITKSCRVTTYSHLDCVRFGCDITVPIFDSYDERDAAMLIRHVAGSVSQQVAASVKEHIKAKAARMDINPEEAERIYRDITRVEPVK